MAFKDLFFNKKEVLPLNSQIEEKKVSRFHTEFGAYDGFCLPNNQLVKTSRGYLQGEMGLYSQELNYLYNHSSLHSAIINFKTLLTAGNGYTLEGVDTLTGDKKIALYQLTNQIDSILNKVAFDYHLHGRICLKIEWNSDNTKILELKRVSPEKIHISEYDFDEDKPICYLYNWDWSWWSKFPTKEYYNFDQMDKNHKCQLFFYQIESANQVIYNQPTYISALNWIVIHSETSQYHKSAINNSLNPSMLIQYLEEPADETEERKILQGVNQSFAGARKTGRAMITFSNGKDLAPLITQMEPMKLDKTFLQLSDTIQREISYAHNINPVLLGLKTPGSLGESASLPESYAIFNESVIKPAQKEIEYIINKFIKINEINGVTFNLNQSDLFKNDNELTTTN